MKYIDLARGNGAIDLCLTFAYAAQHRMHN